MINESWNKNSNEGAISSGIPIKPIHFPIQMKAAAAPMLTVFHVHLFTCYHSKLIDFIFVFSVLWDFQWLINYFYWSISSITFHRNELIQMSQIVDLTSEQYSFWTYNAFQLTSKLKLYPNNSFENRTDIEESKKIVDVVDSWPNIWINKVISSWMGGWVRSDRCECPAY